MLYNLYLYCAVVSTPYTPHFLFYYQINAKIVFLRF